MKTLLIRADASSRIGTGHLMRMIALAEAWRRRSGQAVFISCVCPDTIHARILEAGFEHVRIEAEPGSELDLNALIEIIRQYPDCCIALDNYHFLKPYQEGVQSAVSGKMLMVDDYGHQEQYTTDILLNQNPSASILGLKSKAPGARLLLGTDYCLLREEFIEGDQVSAIRETEALNLLVLLGGGDPDFVTGKVLKSISSLSACIKQARVLVGGANPHLEKINQLASQAEFSCEVIENAKNMPEQLRWADCAISAAGSTCWELAYYKVPTALIVIAENQKKIAETLARKEAIVYLGEHTDSSTHNWTLSLEPFLKSPENRILCAEKFGTLVDGAGADRVAAALDKSLKINILTQSEGWLKQHVYQWATDLKRSGHDVLVLFSENEIVSGDILFILSFWGLIPSDSLKRNTHNLVVHESDLPQGRGWSPVSWQVLEGRHKIPVCLFEAEERVDSGKIYVRSRMELKGTELLDDIHLEQARVTFDVCEKFIQRYPEIISEGLDQSGEPSFYKRRSPKDSRLDPDKTIREQFNLLRVVDNQSYPAFFDLDGCRYELKITSEFCPESQP